MDCNAAHHLLERGVAPSSADATRAMLGFHLAGCAPCRSYRDQIATQCLLTALLARPMPSPALALCEPAPAARRRGLSARQAASAALLIAAAVAAVPIGQVIAAQTSQSKAPANQPAQPQMPVTAIRLPESVAQLARISIEGANLARPNAVALPLVAQLRAKSSQTLADERLLADLHALAVPRRPQNAVALNTNAAAELFAPGQGFDTARSQIAAFAQAGPQALPPQALDLLLDPAIANLPLQAGQTLLLPEDPPVPEPPPPVVIAPDIAVPSQPQPRPTTRPTVKPTVKPMVKPTVKPVSRPPGQAAPAARTYIVQTGDTLTSIALRFYDSAARWPEVYRANRTVVGSNPDLIRPNQRLVIPGVRATGSGQVNAAPTGEVYTVRGGDTLTDIALRFYGNANLWPLLYNANRDTVGGNPDLIFPQQRLAIPRSSQPATTPKPTAVPKPTAQPTQPPNNQLPPPLPPSQRSYTVLRGDSLRSIAQRAYGNEARWRDIYQANRANIPNADALRIGLVLTLP